jgi:galactonate dehydratase
LLGRRDWTWVGAGREDSGVAKITAVRPLVCETGQGRTFLFVVVETDAGVSGVGEGSQNDQDAAVAANVRQLAPSYVGQDPLETIEARGRLLLNNRTGRAISVAVSAIEQALWDVVGKLLNVPVYQLLGGWAHQGADRLRCYATMSAGIPDTSPAGIGQEAARCAEIGYTGVKVVPFRGVGAQNFDSAAGRPRFREGVARAAAAREAMGADRDVLIECANSFDYSTARRVAQALEPYDCFWLEAPLAWDEGAELARLRGQVKQRIASGEQLHGRRAFRELLEHQAVDVLQPDVKWTGGIYEAKKIAAWAETYQTWIAPHNNSGPVATAASAHLSASLPNFLILETPSRALEWEDELLRGTGLVQGGHVTLERLRERPGLGIEFDEAVAKKHEKVV